MNPIEKEIAAQQLAAGVTNAALAQSLGVKAREETGMLARKMAQVKADPEVQERAVEIVKTRFAAAGVTAERTMVELARVAYSNAKDLFHPDGRLKSIHEMDDDTAATIVSVEVEDKPEVVPPKRKVDKRFAGWEESDTNDPDFQPTVTNTRVTKLKRADKMAALSIFAKHFKIVSNEDGGVDALAGALADRLNAANRRAMQRPPLSTDVSDARIIDPDPFGLVQTAPASSTPPAPRVIDSTEPQAANAPTNAAPASVTPTTDTPGAPHEDVQDDPLW